MNAFLKTAFRPLISCECILSQPPRLLGFCQKLTPACLGGPQFAMGDDLGGCSWSKSANLVRRPATTKKSTTDEHRSDFDIRTQGNAETRGRHRGLHGFRGFNAKTQMAQSRCLLHFSYLQNNAAMSVVAVLADLYGSHQSLQDENTNTTPRRCFFDRWN